MNPVRSILYLGSSNGTSLHRARALERLGHRVDVIDPYSFLPRWSLLPKVYGKVVREFGGAPIEPYVRASLLRALAGRSYDVAWINGGELFGPETVRMLRRFAPRVLNYNNDDPFGPRDGKTFALYRAAVAEYDLLVVLRDVNVTEARHAGARRVLRVPFSTSDEAHRPFESIDELRGWESEVVFVGTWMAERGPVLARLLDLGVPLSIYGDRWQRSAEWPRLRAAWKGPNLIERDYVRAIQGAKVCIGLLSKGNRDLSTARSAEIPYIGRVLCAERTIEHQGLYDEGREAAFWDTPEECASRCRELLQDPDLRERIALAGRARCISNGLLDSVVVKRILDDLFLG